MSDPGYAVGYFPMPACWSAQQRADYRAGFLDGRNRKPSRSAAGADREYEVGYRHGWELPANKGEGK